MLRTMCKPILLCGATAMLAIGNHAYAQQPSLSYDYVEVGATKGEISNIDYTAYGLGGSFSLNNAIFMSADYANGTSDKKYFGSKIDIDAYSIGLGYHTAINSKTDFVTSLSYIKNEVDFARFNDNTNAYGIDVGVRSMVLPNVELAAIASYVDSSDADGEIGFNLNAKFFVSPVLAVTLGYTDGDDTSGVSAGLRLNF